MGTDVRFPDSLRANGRKSAQVLLEYARARASGGRTALSEVRTMSVGEVLRDVVKDLALLVFDRAVARARAKFPSAERLLVDREDIIAAVIELRYEQLAVVCSQLDVLRAEGERELLAAQMRGRENYGTAEDHVDTVIVAPDGTEPETQPFKK